MQYTETIPPPAHDFDKIEKWKNCTLCQLCKTRDKVVLWRGYLGCQVLFVGEAPGAFEDSRGLPFVGPAGKKLDEIIFAVESELLEDGQDPLFTYAITNLICCIPKTEKEIRIPKKEEIKACSGRLKEFVEVASPSLIVRVGKLAATNFSSKLPTVDIVHPTAILQADPSQQGVIFRKAVCSVFNAITRMRKMAEGN